MIIKDTVFIAVYYYLPDYNSIINEFWWQHQDYVPELPRTHAFLNFWKDNIDAVIKEVQISHARTQTWRKVDWDYRV